MQYEAKLTAENGAFHTFEFEADMACLAVGHLIHVANDPAMLKPYPGGIARWDKEPIDRHGSVRGNVVKMEYRRLYKNGGIGNWRVA